MKQLSRKIHLIIIILITSLLYLNTSPNKFVGDDHGFILEWHETRSLTNIPPLLAGSVPFGHTGVYRPLRGIFYTLSYQLWGTNPVGYHFQALLVHLICTILVYFIVFEITKKQSRQTMAFISSLVFGIHPIHTESITSITASFDTIAAIFFLASFYFYVKAQTAKPNLKSAYFASIIFALLAFFTYEITLTLPLLIILYDICFKKTKRKNLESKIKAYSPYFIGILFYFFIRFFVLNIVGRGSYLANSFYLTMLATTKVFLKYILLVLIPINLNINHHISRGILSYTSDISEKAVLAQSIFDLHIIFSIAVIAILLIIAIKSFKKRPWVSFCIGWFFIALAPVSNIVPQAALLAERYLYIPLFGFCLLVSFIVEKIQIKTKSKNRNKKKGLRVISLLLLILIIATYSALTVSRNADWKTELTLWSDTVEKSPSSAIAHTHLGNAYQNLGETENAINEYLIAIKLNPDYSKSYYSLGYTYQNQQKWDLAVEQYQISISANPDYAKAHNNLGTIYKSQGKLGLAITEYKTAISANPNYPQAHYNLGNVYFIQGKLDLAIEEYNKALAINPKYDKALYNLELAYQKKNNQDES